tara:strand:+ start:105 stop:347 length:243 start_codon:yes stop_codon:yes gene_type:complete
MTIPKVIDKREMWLEGLGLQAADVLKRFQKREINGITPTNTETDIMDLCGGYLYLLELAKDHGLFESEDPFNLFEKETLH